MSDLKPLSRKLQVLFLSIGKFLTTITALLSSIFLSRLLSIDEYANYRQVILVYVFVTPLLSLGFDRSIFYNFEKSKTNQGEQILNIQYVILSIALLFSVFFILGGAGLISQVFNNPKLEKGIIIYSIFSIFNLPLLLIQPVLVLGGKVKLLTIFNVINKLFSVLIGIIIAFYFREANSILVALLFTGVFFFIITQVILLKNSSKIRSFVFDQSIVKDYFKIGIPLMIASMLGTVGKNIDKVIVSSMMSPSDFAIYVNGAMEIPFIASITGSVMVVIIVDFTKLLGKGKIKETFDLWNRAVESTSSLLIPIAFVLFLNADWLIIAMFGKSYSESAIPFKIYLFLLPLRTMIFSSLITASGKTKLISKGAFLFVISNVITSVVFIKIFGFIGPALATVITTYMLGFYYSYHIAKNHKISIFRVFAVKNQKYYLFIGLISILASTFIPRIMKLDTWLQITVSNFIFVTTFSFGVLIFGKKSIYINMIKIFKSEKNFN